MSSMFPSSWPGRTKHPQTALHLVHLKKSLQIKGDPILFAGLSLHLPGLSRWFDQMFQFQLGEINFCAPQQWCLVYEGSWRLAQPGAAGSHSATAKRSGQARCLTGQTPDISCRTKCHAVPAGLLPQAKSTCLKRLQRHLRRTVLVPNDTLCVRRGPPLPCFSLPMESRGWSNLLKTCFKEKKACL